MNHTRLTMSATAALAVALLAGCDSTTTGSPKSGLPSGETSAASTPTPSEKAIRPVPVSPIPVPSAVPPTAQALAPQNGYVFIQTKSGKTRCQLDEQEVGCESAFTNAPEVEGEPANGDEFSVAPSDKSLSVFDALDACYPAGANARAEAV